jgi:acyl-CoA synthetase (NDP forming)
MSTPVSSLTSVEIGASPEVPRLSAHQDRVTETVRSLRPLFNPGAIAVIGATEHAGPGHQVVHNLVGAGFTGRIVAVHPTATSVLGLPTVHDIRDASRVAGRPIDLAVIIVPFLQVEGVVELCAQAKVGSLVIISAGFAEADDNGRVRQQRIRDIARANGMRLVGPNCLGIANTSSEVSMNATFVSAPIPPGKVAVMTQSGAVGIALLDGLARRGLGVSTFASVGNKADVSGNDLLTYWAQDNSTNQIVLYLESLGNPRAFAEIAPAVSARKPIIAIKSGRTSSAARAASSHTAALALPDDAVDALLRQAGVLRADDLDELLDLCVVLDSQPLPTGRRVAVVTNAGGPAILASDVFPRFGLQMAILAASTQATVAGRLGRSVNEQADGPIDVRADASPTIMAAVIADVIGDPNVDAVIVIVADVSGNGTSEFTDAIGVAHSRRSSPHVAEGTTRRAIPVVCAFVPDSAGTAPEAVATLPSPERAVRAIARLAERAEWLNRHDHPTYEAHHISDEQTKLIRSRVDAWILNHSTGGWMDPVTAFGLVNAAGISVALPTFVVDPSQAIDAAQSIGYPVVLKAVAEQLVHRTESGAVRVGLRDDFDVACAFELMSRKLGLSMTGATVQPMARAGVELLAGIVNHPHLGALVVVGEGGVLAELRHDTAVRRVPLNASDAQAQLDALRISGLLSGFRGSPSIDRDLLSDVLVRLSELAELVPEIAELDINPLIVSAHSATAVDVKIRLKPLEVIDGRS